jgi:hypothetical protein
MLRVGFALSGVALLASSADAALERYRLRKGLILSEPGFSDPIPGCDYGSITECGGRAIVETGAPDPVLRDFHFVTDASKTFFVGLSGYLFLSFDTREGSARPATGQGSTAPGSTLRWGSVSGWSITGSVWCKSAPSVICSLVSYSYQTTVDPPLDSTFYDLGTWTYHGTGFTGTPFVKQFFTTSSGNALEHYSGFRLANPGASALPALGIASAASLIAAAAGFALSRSRAPGSD